MVCKRPRFRVCQQCPPYAAAILAGRDGDVGNMAGALAGKEITLDLQVQEAEARAVPVVDDKELDALVRFAQRAVDIGAYRGQAIAPAAAFGQFERDETRHQRQDEIMVVACGGPYRHRPFAEVGHGFRAFGLVIPGRRSFYRRWDPEPVCYIEEEWIPGSVHDEVVDSPGMTTRGTCIYGRDQCQCL